ncbi:hypothetical protein [uncultured Shewanella sp.]|uniref:hypothetical protein n=1 Tax=uncultured Shewanella sp. TaxID=173975 RepID=UPI00262E4E0A|nr:hypothetical protein [uncultured Shewanella sp.]
MRVKQIRVLLLCLLVMILPACLEEGSTRGNKKWLLNASILKGQLKKASVSVFDNQGNWLWEGKSDDLGQVSIPLFSQLSGELSIEVVTSDETRMRCDAKTCVDQSTQLIYQFNDIMPNSGLGALKLSSYVDLNHLNDNQNQTIQVNSLTHLAKTYLDTSTPILLEREDEDFSQYGQYASQVILRALGLALPSDVDLFSLPQVDLNETLQFEGMSEQLILLSLINASFSSDIHAINHLSSALQAVSLDPTNIELQNTLEGVQKNVLKATEALITLPELPRVPNKVVNQIDTAATTPLDFSALTQAMIFNTSVPADNEIKQIRASSSHWSPTISNMREKTWWWVSQAESGINEWIQLDYAQSMQPSYVRLSVDKRFQGVELKLQGRSIEEPVWVDLTDNLSSALVTQGQLDEKNTLTLLFPLALSASYSSFRLYSLPPNVIWLEAFCLFTGTDEPKGQCVNDGSVLPESVLTSSLYFSPKNVIEDQGYFWLSGIAVGEPQWLSIEYFNAFQAQRVQLSAHKDYLGTDPVIQGMDSQGDWHTLLELDVNALQKEANDKGIVSVDLGLNVHQAYQRYRYYSDVTIFVQLFSLTFIP